MPSPNWNDDDELMSDLVTALQEPPAVDERFLHAARGAFAWRTVDTDLERVAMLYDSALDAAPATRGQPLGAPRTLAFQGEQLGVEIELSDDRIEGQLIPAQPGEVTLLTPAGRYATVTADAVGCFWFPAPPRGPIRLECGGAGGRFTTEWVTV
jgi:hypothetical protein